MPAQEHHVQTWTSTRRLAMTAYAALLFCLLGLLAGYLAFRLLVGVETDCDLPTACGSSARVTRWTLTGGGVGIANGVLASLTSLATQAARTFFRDVPRG